MEKNIHPGYRLLETSITVDAHKLVEYLHECIMEVATKLAKNKDVCAYGEATAYLNALMEILRGNIPSNVRSSIFDEYYAMLFGNRPSVGR